MDLLDSNFPREGRIPLDVVCYTDNASPILMKDEYKKYALWILTDKGSERVRVENFEWKPEYDISGISMVLDKFLNGEKFISQKMNAHQYTAYTYSNWILDKLGNWYWYNLVLSASFCTHPVNITKGTTMPYKAAPYIFGKPGVCAVLFNEDANRFEWQNADANARSATMYSDVLTTTNIFDWQNPNYRLLYMGHRTASAGFAVVENVFTTRFEFLYWVASSGNPPSKDDRKDFPFDRTIPVKDFKHYVYHKDLPYLYCATEDKLYKIDVTSMPATGWTDVTSQVLPAGHKFSKVMTTYHFQPIYNDERFNPRTDQIAVCTYDPYGEPGQNGQLSIYNVEHGTGNLVLAKHPTEPTEDGYQIDMEWTGFGKIIGLDYKNVP
jgi:hypothetical protein